MTPNLTSDWQIWDNLETVNVTGEDGETDYTYANLTAKRRALTYRELLGSGGAFMSADLVWLVPVEVLPDGAIPRLADRVEDSDGVVWTILEASLNTWRTWWRLTTRNLVASSNLQSLVSLYQPNDSQDLAGVQVPGYSLVAADIPASLGEVAAGVEDRLGKRQAVRQFQALLGQWYDLSGNWRLVDADGQVYQITGWRPVDQWEVLQEVDLEIVQ